MKRVVFSLSFFFLLSTFSTAFHPETLDLTQVFNHHHHKHHHHLLSSDGSDSSKILLPTDDSSVLDNTQSYVVEVLPEDSNPVQLKNRHSLPVYRFNPIRCRQIHRFMRHPRRFGGVNELGFDPVLTYVLQNRDLARKFPEVESAIRMFDQHHMGPLHHPHHHHDHQRLEMKEDEEEEETENKVEKKRKEKDDDEEEEEERENEVEKKYKKKDGEKKHKRKEKNAEKKRKEKDEEEERENKVEKKHKKKDNDEEDEDKVKDVLKKVRKFLNYF